MTDTDNKFFKALGLGALIAWPIYIIIKLVKD